MRIKRVKNILIVVLMTGLIGLTIAYAAIVKKLQIIKMQDAMQGKGKDWDIHFLDVSCYPVGMSKITSPLTLTSSTTLEGLKASFYKPGDSVVCTFYVENSGGFDAYLNGYLKQNPIETITYTGKGSQKNEDENLVKGNINYSLVYVDNNTEPKEYDVLNVNEKRKLRLQLQLDYSLKELPKEDVLISNFSTSMLYTQK